MLDRSLDRLGAGVAEGDDERRSRGRTHELGEPLGKPSRCRSNRALCVKRGALVEQPLRERDELRLVVLEHQGAIPPEHVEDANLFSVVPVSEVVASRARVRDVEAKSGENGSQIRAAELAIEPAQLTWRPGLFDCRSTFLLQFPHALHRA